MTIFQIYFIVAAAILLSKFLFSICTFNRLKLFVSEYKLAIDELIDKGSLSYSDLVIYHFSSKSVKRSDYSDEMRTFLIQGTGAEIMMYILFAIFWIISIPTVLLCLLLAWLGEKFEKFSKSILS
jgi:hypothetical protein